MSTFKELKHKEREARRKMIITAAQKLFSEKDFRKVTAREIAKTTGISPASIYRYYKNMDELFLDVFLIHANEMSLLAEAEIKENIHCSIARYCEIHVTYLNDNMTFYQMMAHFMLSEEPSSENSGKIDPVMRTLLDYVEKILIDNGKKENSRLVAHALFSALNGTMISYARYPGRTLSEIKQHTLCLAQVIADQFSNGI